MPSYRNRDDYVFGLLEPPHIDRGTELVKVIVGPDGDARNEQMDFVVHKSLLVASSRFFEIAFSRPFLEGQTQQIHLKEEEPILFACFLDWLYCGLFDVESRAFGDARKHWSEDLCWFKRKSGCCSTMTFMIKERSAFWGSADEALGQNGMLPALQNTDWPIASSALASRCWHTA
jgi:hypothetical protein